MTITVSIEELKAYQAACLEWTVKRARFFDSLLVRQTDVLGFSQKHAPESAKDRIAQWEKENPIPKLLPSL